MNTTCTNCGFVFQSPIHMGMGTVGTFSNVNTNCPRCGRMVPVIADGTYDFDNNGEPTPRKIADFLSQGGFSKRQLLALQLLAQQAQKTPSEINNFVANANSIAPSLGDKLEQYFKGRQFTMQALYIILTALSLLLGIATYNNTRPAEQLSTDKVRDRNTYNLPTIGVPSARKQQIQERKTVKRGSNLTPPKKTKKKR